MTMMGLFIFNERKNILNVKSLRLKNDFWPKKIGSDRNELVGPGGEPVQGGLEELFDENLDEVGQLTLDRLPIPEKQKKIV